MIDHTTEELMWQHIDGTISTSDRIRLEKILKTDPEAKAHMDELRRLAEFLSDVPEVDPPADLRRRTESALDPNRYARHRSPSHHRLRGLPAFQLSWSRGVRYAAVAVAGFLVGVVAYHTWDYDRGDQRSLDISRLSGTMFTPPGNTVEIDAGVARGTVDIYQDGTTARLEIDMGSERRVEVVVESEVWPLKFGAVGASDDAEHTVSVRDGAVVFSNRGEGTFYAVFEVVSGSDGTFRLSVRDGGATVLERVLEFSESRQ